MRALPVALLLLAGPATADRLPPLPLTIEDVLAHGDAAPQRGDQATLRGLEQLIESTPPSDPARAEYELALVAFHADQGRYYERLASTAAIGDSGSCDKHAQRAATWNAAAEQRLAALTQGAPLTDRALLGLVLVRARKGLAQSAAALDAYRTLVTRHPRSPWLGFAHAALGDLYAPTEEASRATPYYERAARSSARPAAAYARYQLGTLKLRAGDARGAAVALAKAASLAVDLKADPVGAAARAELVELLPASMAPRAIVPFLRTSLGPSRAPALAEAMATSLASSGQPADGAVVLKALVASFAKAPRACVWRATLAHALALAGADPTHELSAARGQVTDRTTACKRALEALD